MEPIGFSEEQQIAVCEIIKTYVEEFGISNVTLTMPISWQALDVDLGQCKLKFNFHELNTLVVSARIGFETVQKEFRSQSVVH
jgi:hypothetical protein